MLATLLIVIFISFIGVGLPDSVLGTAWPAMYREFDLPISLAGYITSTVSIGTIISSLMSSKLISKFGTGLVTAVSTLLTAVALLGFSLTQNPVFFFLLAIPLGLGAGAIDTALNAFVALHYTASQMSFLHCFYGLGVAASPFVMSLALGSEGNWRRGYLIVAIIQFSIAAIGFLSLPLWKKVQKKDAEETDITVRTLSIPELVKTPGVMLSCFSFFFNCALELTAGGWSSSFFVNTKGINPDRAALITMLFYIGLACGRFVSGMLAGKLGRRRLLRIALAVQFVSILLFILPLPTVVSAVALFFIGLGIGPVYPNLVHLTPKNFGEDVAQSVMGLQQAMTYAGIMLMPWLFGILAQIFTTALLPYYMMLMLLFYAIAFTALMRTVSKKKRKTK